MTVLGDVIQRGTRAAQPGAGTVPAGTLYFVTDEGKTERSTGAAWEDYTDTGGSGAPVGADYLVKTAHGGLSAERVVTDTAEIAVDWATAGQAKFNLVANSIAAARATFAATKRLFGRNTAGAGAGEEVTWEQARAWATQKIWTPDFPPASPGALDDEFQLASGGVPAGWTEYDHASEYTITEDSAPGVKILYTGTTANRLGGIYKADPGGDITIVAKVSMSSLRSLSSCMGIGWLRDGALSTADVHWVRVANDGTSMYILTSLWTAYNVFSSNPVTMADVLGLNGVYLRMRRTGTTYLFDWSSDGVGWMGLSSGTISFTPTHVGIIGLSATTGSASSSRCWYFRSTNSDIGIAGQLGGKYL